MEKIIGKKIICFDGAMGTMLQEQAIKLDSLPETINITNPNIVIEIHKQYLEAGADIITANTFGVNSLKYTKNYTAKEIVKEAITLAKQAIKESKHSNKYVAMDIGPTGKLLAPLGELEFETAIQIYKEITTQAEEAGADLILIETMMDLLEAKAAIIAAKESTKLPIFCTMTFENNKRTMTGTGIASMVATLEGLNVNCLGINCGQGPEQAKEIIKEVLAISSIPVMIQSNAGMPEVIEGKTTYKLSAQHFAEEMKEIAQMGVWAIGGCCGTTPQHIKTMSEEIKNITPKPITPKETTVVTSATTAVVIGEEPIIIGERINPTGKKRLKEALISENYTYLISEATAQKEAGAQILDVNVGLPEINETKTMTTAIKTIQQANPLPLQIDSSNPEVFESALRIYNGKALINSVNGKKETMEKIFPIAKKYGGVVVGLTLDERGIPASAEGRLEIANKIIETAKQYGIEKKNIIIDTLTLTAGAQQKEATETLKAIKKVKKALTVRTILGISNISFGLPERMYLNSTFLAMALNSGLDACIINPLSQPMMNTIRSYNVLNGTDINAKKYIEHHTKEANNSQVETIKAPATLTIKEIIIKGNKEQAYDVTSKQLTKTKPLELIDEELIPALNEIGTAYENSQIFLPQLMLSAQTAKEAFRAIKDHMEKEGMDSEPKGKIILATVKGDIHDIGKNIVKALLENYSYEIIDLGKDVNIEEVVNTAIKNDIKLIGLSALMTTTVENMEKTIKAIKESNHDCKIIVGGAVLNKEYAKMIGADYYGKDALAAVSIAKEIFETKAL